MRFHGFIRSRAILVLMKNLLSGDVTLCNDQYQKLYKEYDTDTDFTVTSM
jgi:hypothetical protein